MKKLLLSAVLFLASLSTAAVAQSVSVSVNLKSLFTTPEQSTSQVCVTLALPGHTSFPTPRVVGTGVIVPTQTQCQSPNASGVVTFNLYGNDQLTVSGQIGATYYIVEYYLDGVEVSGDNYVFNVADSPVDLSVKTPISVLPTIAAPTGDSTYARLDGGNQPFAAPIRAPSLNGTGTNGNINIPQFNNTCVANLQAGTDLGAKINACLALGAGTDILITAPGTISTQVLISNLSNIRIRGIGGLFPTNLTNGITGTNAQPAIKITGNSQHIILEDFSVSGNSLTGAGGNGNGIAIIGTGATPSQIWLTNVSSQFNQGTGLDGTGAGIAASGLYVYQSIDVYVDGGFYGANQQGILLDNAVNNVQISRTGIFANVKSAILTKNGVARINIGPNNDMESNATVAGDNWLNIDGCSVCSVFGNWFESNSGHMVFSDTFRATQLDFYDNIIIHGANGSTANTSFAFDSTGFVDLNIHDNDWIMEETMATIIDLNPSSNASIGKRISGNTFEFASGGLTLNAINWQPGTHAGKCVIDGNSFGSTNNTVFTGPTAIDIGAGENGCRVQNNSCSTSSGTLTNCVKVESGASNTFISNTATSGAGTITNVVADSGTNTTCVGQGCAVAFTTSTIRATALQGPGLKVQQFTSSGTFTIPAGITQVKVTVVGGGGAGGGSAGTTAGTGGGSGGVGIKWLTGLTPGNTLAVTVGGGGAGASNANGGNGSASSVASGTQTITAISANGGNGGTANASGGGQGGSAGSGGDMNFVGTTGTEPGPSFSGNGGSSIFGGGGPFAAAAGNPGTSPGAGGSGAGKGSGNQAGGNGAAGLVIFEWVN